MLWKLFELIVARQVSLPTCNYLVWMIYLATSYASGNSGAIAVPEPTPTTIPPRTESQTILQKIRILHNQHNIHS